MSDEADGWHDIEFKDVPSRDELVEQIEDSSGRAGGRRGKCAMHGAALAN